MAKLYPLTREQQGLYVEFKRDEDDISYNTCVQVSIEGEIDANRFLDAASKAVKHFDMLRAYIVEENFKPLLAFSEEKYVFPFEDYSNGNLPESEKLKQKALEKLNEVRLTPISLNQFPLINAHLIKTSKDKFYFIGVVPHMISDGFSATLFLQALSACYNEGEAALEEKFPYSEVSWPKYLEYRQEKFPESEISKAFDYWQENLADASHQVELGGKPCKRSSNLGKKYKFDLDGDSALLLRKIARANKTALFSVMSASLVAFLNRYYASQEMVIGYPVNLRPAGYKNAFGFYVNVLPLKINLEGDVSFNELVAKTHQQRKEDKPFQFLPSLDIVRSKRKTDPSFDGRMFNISMAQTVSRLQNLDIDNVVSKSIDSHDMEIKDDLSFIYEVNEDGISFWFEYLCEMFSQKQIADMAKHFIYLLKQMASDPDEKIASFDLLDQEEKSEFIEKSQSFDKESSIIAEFQKSVKNNPDAIALNFNGENISYRELDENSNLVANSLLNKVKNGQKYIALILPYGIERITSMLAALKAGLAYVPIDPDAPLNRINTIIDDAKITEVISLKKIAVKADNLIFADLQKGNSSDLVTRNDAAYIIYTSGSSGTPKGVLVHQAEVLTRLNWLKKTFKIGVGNQVLQSTNYSFDISVAEIFWPLLVGATLVILDEEKKKDFKYQSNLIMNNKIDVACMVPSSILALLKALKSSDKLPFKYLLSCGEPLKKDLADKYYEFGEDGSLYNLYGPTEAVIYASYKQINKNDEITIGKKIANCDLYILNSKNKLQPKFAYGELCIGGALASRYLNREELTSEKFIKNPYGKDRLYKSGDLVYFDENKDIKYLGRIDNQIKLRGYRIEIDEISAKLNDLAAIDESIVVVNNNSLIACYASNKAIAESEIIKYLQEYLPSYMLPTHFVKFDNLAKLASGKLNSKQIKKDALLKINNSKDSKKEKLILPKTKKEKAMAKIWANILRIPPSNIGIHSNFFDLGGDSLMVIELECLAEKEGIYLDANTIFSNPTIAALLENASDKPINKFSQALVQGQVKLLPRQLKFFASNFKNPNQWNRCISIESKRDINIELLKESLAEIITHHDALRLSFAKEKEIWQGYNHDKLEPIVNIYDFSKEKKSDRLIKNALNDELASFDLAKPPLVKAIYFKKKKNYQLSLIVHHLLVDMRSIRILLEDLMMNFMAKIQKEPFIMPFKTSSVQEYSNKLHNYIANNDFEEEIKYWQSELQDVKDDKKEVLESDLESKSISLSKKQTDNFLREAKEQNVNIHEYLLAKFAAAYKNHFDTKSLVLNTCFHGRDDIFEDLKITKTIGWFNTVFPININLNSENIAKEINQKFSQIPNRSINYLPLRFIKKDPRLTSLVEPKIFFNYVSKIDKDLPEEFMQKAPFKIIEDENLELISKEEKSCYGLYIEAALVDDKLEARISHSSLYSDFINSYFDFLK